MLCWGLLGLASKVKKMGMPSSQINSMLETKLKFDCFVCANLRSVLCAFLHMYKKIMIHKFDAWVHRFEVNSVKLADVTRSQGHKVNKMLQEFIDCSSTSILTPSNM